MIPFAPAGQAQPWASSSAVSLCRTADPPLQVTKGPRRQPRRLRQLLLGQPGLGPQLPHQPGKRKRRLLRHRPRAPRTPRAQTTVTPHYAAPARRHH
jgi:hypothetical protein